MATTEKDGALEHKSVSLSLRAPRIALLFRKSEKWRESVQLMLAHATKRWGGQHIVLVPHDEMGQINPEILGLLEQFDPDYTSAPNWGIGAYHRIWPIQLEREGVQLSGEELSAAVDEMDELGETYRDPYSRYTEGELAKTFPTLRTYATDKDPLGEPRQLDIEVSVGNADLSSGSRRSLAVETSWTSDTSLMCGTMFGVVEPSGDTTEHEPDWTSQLAAYIGILGRRRFPETGEGAWSTADPSLNWMQTGYPGANSPIVLGDTVEDFCLFLLLQRMLGHAYWLPADLLDNFEKQTSTAEFVHMAFMSLYGNDPIECHSISVPAHEIESTLAVLNANPMAELMEIRSKSRVAFSKALRFVPTPIPRVDTERDLFIEGGASTSGRGFQSVPLGTAESSPSTLLLPRSPRSSPTMKGFVGSWSYLLTPPFLQDETCLHKFLREAQTVH